MGVLKVWDGTDWRKVGCNPGPIDDDFNRTDGPSLVLDRSDGGLWTADSDGTFEILTNRLVLTARTSTDVRLRAEYGDKDVTTITAHVGVDTFAADQFFKLYWADDLGGYCYGLSLYAAEQYFGLFRGDGPVSGETTLAVNHFSVPDYAATGAHDLVIVYDRPAKHHHITWDGTVIHDHTDTVTRDGEYFEFAFTRTYSEAPYFVDSINVTGTTPPGRLRLQLPDGSWVREACPGDGTIGGELVPPLSTGWKYYEPLATDTSTAYAAPSYDDSAWGTGQGYFGAGAVISGRPYNTAWLGATTSAPATVLWVRRVIPEAATSPYSVTVWVDDECEIWWNGTSLGTYSFGIDGFPLTVVVPSTAVVAGPQLLAIRAVDDGTPGGNCALDVSVSTPTLTTAHPLKIEDPASPGTWITVACIVPAVPFTFYDTATFDTAVYN